MRLFFLSVSLTCSLSLSLSLYFYLCVCYFEFTSLWGGECLFDTCWHAHTLASVHSGIDTNLPVFLHPHTLSPPISPQHKQPKRSRSPFLWFRCGSAEKIKMRCWQADVERTRPTNLWPALWSLCHQVLLEPSIRMMKCNILNWHNHRAKSSLLWRH